MPCLVSASASLPRKARHAMLVAHGQHVRETGIRLSYFVSALRGLDDSEPRKVMKCGI